MCEHAEPSNVLELGVTRQTRQNSNGSADTPTCADIDSSGGGGLEWPPATRDDDAGTLPVPDQGDAGPETLAGDGEGLQVSLSEVRLHEISLAAAGILPNEQAVSPIWKGVRPGVDEEEWRVRWDRLSMGRGPVPKVGSGEDLATTSMRAGARSAGQRGRWMPPARRYTDNSSAIVSPSPRYSRNPKSNAKVT